VAAPAAAAPAPRTLTRNARGLPEESRDAYGATNILDDIYDYDPNGNVAAITDGATGQAQRGNRTMTYDALDRLTDTTSPMYGTTGAHYTYDALDNLTSTTAPGRSGAWAQAYCYDAHQWLTNVKIIVQGNMNNWNGKLHNFDFGNRLRAVTDVESYRYDAYGRPAERCRLERIVRPLPALRAWPAAPCVADARSALHAGYRPCARHYGRRSGTAPPQFDDSASA
jgi:YD repeat-containing protein